MSHARRFFGVYLFIVLVAFVTGAVAGSVTRESSPAGRVVKRIPVTRFEDTICFKCHR